MLKELAEYLAQQGVDTKSGKVVKEYDDRLLIRNPDGTLAFMDGPPKVRTQQAFSLVGVTDMAKRFADLHPEIWYSRSRVTCLLNSATRFDRVDFALQLSEQMKYLQQLGAARPMLNQKALVLLLRTTYHGCFAREPGLLDAVRNVRFMVNQSGESSLGHGKASIGKRIESDLTGAATIPEYCTLTVPVFENLQGVTDVLCAIELHSDTQNFQLIPLPGQIERALQNGEAMIDDMLSDILADADNVHVYQGIA